jgi:5'-methylthioadenosine phosphorylase/5'-methylthioinosine phosphorylase
MSRLAVIGGSGFAALTAFEELGRELTETPYGPPSAPIIRGRIRGRELLFLPRHGSHHDIPPHRVNYRANVWALAHCGAERIIGLAAVGGISPAYGPAVLALPDQILDYTYGRAHTFFDGDDGEVVHIDFTRPYCEALRCALLAAAPAADVDLVDGATYAVTQGPRLESAAEVLRLERDGCDLVGMTGMPEAALARELEVCYACCAFVVNWAAGKAESEIQMSDVRANIAASSVRVRRLLDALMAADMSSS